MTIVQLVQKMEKWVNCRGFYDMVHMRGLLAAVLVVQSHNKSVQFNSKLYPKGTSPDADFVTKRNMHMVQIKTIYTRSVVIYIYIYIYDN